MRYVLGSVLTLIASLPAWGQTFQPGLTPLPALPDTLATPAPIPLITPPAAEQPTTETDINVVLQQIEIRGSSVFAPEDFGAIAAPYLNRPLVFEDLLALRTAITQLYSERGYITSGAFLPPQDLTSGSLIVQVIEGELEAVNIIGLQRLRDRYVRDRINLAAQAPIDIAELEEALQLLQQDPLFSSIRAELTAGTGPGRSVLELEIVEASAFTLGLSTSSRDDSTNSNFQPTIRIEHRNLTGLGDRLAISSTLTESGNSYAIAYRLPINPRNGTLGVRFSTSDSRIIDPAFAALNISGTSTEWGVQVRQPLQRTPTSEWAIFADLDVKRSQTFLFGTMPFSFVPGAQEGRLRSSVLSLGSEWVDRNETRFLAARTQLNFGLPLFDATQNPEGTPDSLFGTWTGQVQWVQALQPQLLLVGRGSFQLANSTLLLGDRLRLGGIDTVRGYPTGFVSADNGVVGNLELRWQVLDDSEGVGTFQLVSFFDVARLWDHSGAALVQANLASVGAGLNWQLRDRVSAQLSYGIPLRTPDQFVDNGRFSFSIQVNLLN